MQPHEIQGLREKYGLTQQVNPDLNVDELRKKYGLVEEKKDNIATSIVKDIGRPFAKSYVNLVKAGQAFTQGENFDPKAPVDLPFFGPTTPVGEGAQIGEKGAAQKIFGGALGSGLEMASTVIPSGKIAKVPATLMGKAGVAARLGAREGLVSGSLYGTGRSLNEGDGVGEALGSGALSGALGFLGGGVIGGATGLITNKIADKLVPSFKDNKVIEGRTRAFEDLANRTKKNIQLINDARSRFKDFDPLKALSSDDRFKPTVDADGVINTAQGSLELDKLVKQYSPILDEAINQEGKKVSFAQFSRDVLNAIKDKQFEGDVYKRYIQKIKNDLVSYKQYVDDKGMIPLSVLQNIKKAKYGIINWKNPEMKIADRKIAQVAMETIENVSENVKVKEFNQALAKMITMRDVLDGINGSKVKGGRLGRYFSSTIGSVIGTVAGSPLGPAGSLAGGTAGSLISDTVRSSQLKNTFNKAGSVLKNATYKLDDVLQDTSKDVSSKRLKLPSPTRGNKPTEEISRLKSLQQESAYNTKTSKSVGISKLPEALAVTGAFTVDEDGNIDVNINNAIMLILGVKTLKGVGSQAKIKALKDYIKQQEERALRNTNKNVEKWLRESVTQAKQQLRKLEK